MLSRIAAGDVLVGDGGWGSQLIARGLAPGACPERFNLDRPDVLETIGESYIAAGADIITTNSFGGSPLALERHGLEARAAEVNRRAAEIAVRTSSGRALVAGSVGPCGRLLQPYGNVEPAVVEDGFRRQAAALAEGGADLILIETMTDLVEACLAVSAARAEAPTLPVAASMTFESTPRGFFTVMGVSIERGVAGLVEAGADIVGSNCGNGVDLMVEIAEELCRSAEVPVLVQSNAGLPVPSADGFVYPEGPEYFRERIGTMLRLGVRVIGGCCGTTADHIRVIRDVVDGGVPRS